MMLSSVQRWKLATSELCNSTIIELLSIVIDGGGLR